MSRAYISEAKREDIFDLTNGECFYCDKKLCYDNRQKGLRGAWHVDHLIPHSQGGSDDIGNLRAACADCNLSKSDNTEKETFEDGKKRQLKKILKVTVTI